MADAGGPAHMKSKAELDAVIAGSNGKLVVVDFFAEWCGPCKAIAPQFTQWAAEYHDAVFVKVDVDANDELVAQYEISAMPTFKFIKNGEVVETVRGGNPEAIVEAIKTHKTVFATVNFGAAGSKGDGEEAALELTATQLRAVGSFMGVAEGATPGQAVAALRAASWDATGAITEFFGAGVDAAGVEVASVSTAAAGGGLAGASAGGDVKIQVRLGVDARDKHVVSLPDTATGSELLDKLATLVAADVDFTARVRLSKLKKDFALGPADLATPLAGMGLGKRGLVSLIPVNDDPAVVKVLKKL